MRKNLKSSMFLLLMVVSLVLTVGCEDSTGVNKSPVVVDNEKQVEDSSPVVDLPLVIEDEPVETVVEEIVIPEDIFNGYKIIEVDGGNTSGQRESNVVVDIGFGDREYWAFTNEHGQLVRVIAKEIVLQDDSREPVKKDGRYYSKMADVPGVGAATGYDRGHIIADSLGGVANAYNINPQNSTLNRHGNQAYMEKVIRDAGGCTDFEAIITYPNTETQIPSYYKYTYTLKVM